MASKIFSARFGKMWSNCWPPHFAGLLMADFRLQDFGSTPFGHEAGSLLHPRPIPWPARRPEWLGIFGSRRGAHETLLVDPLSVTIAKGLVVAGRCVGLV